MRCPCGGSTAVVTKQVRLEPEGGEALEFPAVAMHECVNCGLAVPTDASRRRLFQALGVHPENPLPYAVRVFVKPVAAEKT